MTEITNEHRAAWKRIEKESALILGTKTLIDPYDLALLTTLLPSELTNPRPVLPTEPGTYIDAGGALVSLDADGWHHAGTWIGPEMLTLPLTRLVPERPQITREQISRALDPHGVSIWSDRLQVDAVLALVNGTDRD